MGNYLMAAITDHDQDIQANADHVEDYLQEVSDEGLVTLATPDGTVLRQKRGQVAFAERSSCLSAMDCTFRLHGANR